MGNHDYAASDHKWLAADFDLPVPAAAATPRVADSRAALSERAASASGAGESARAVVPHRTSDGPLAVSGEVSARSLAEELMNLHERSSGRRGLSQLRLEPRAPRGHDYSGAGGRHAATGSEGSALARLLDRGSAQRAAVT